MDPFIFCGGISLLNKTRLVLFDRNANAYTYINDVLRPVDLPFFRQHFQRGVGILQHDGARPHTAQITRNLLEQHAINERALSSDMSPIEQVWDKLKRRMYTHPHSPQTLRDLRLAFVQEWNNIPQHLIDHMICSMRRRIQALLNAQGGHTRY